MGRMFTIEEMYGAAFQYALDKATEMAIDGAVNESVKAWVRRSERRAAANISEDLRAPCGPERTMLSSTNNEAPHPAFNRHSVNPNYGDERVIAIAKTQPIRPQAGGRRGSVSRLDISTRSGCTTTTVQASPPSHEARGRCAIFRAQWLPTRWSLPLLSARTPARRPSGRAFYLRVRTTSRSTFSTCLGRHRSTPTTLRAVGSVGTG